MASLCYLICYVYFIFFVSSSLSGFNSNVFFVNTGHKHFQFKCIHNITDVQDIRWTFESATKHELKYTIYDKIQDAIHQNFSISCNKELKYCNLLLHEAMPDNAGKYNCTAAQETGKRRILITSVDLAVGGLKCKSNDIKKLVHKGNCHFAENDQLMRSCEFESYGKTYNSMTFLWKSRTEDKLFSSDKTLAYFTMEMNGVKKFQVEDHLLVNENMDGWIFECSIVNQPHLKPCSLPKLNVQYVKKIKTKPFEMITHRLHDTVCHINKSNDVSCSYYWTHENEPAKPIYGKILKSGEIKHPGYYTCTANCQMAKNKICSFEAMEFVLIDISPKSYFYVISFLSITMTFAGIIIGLLWKRLVFSDILAKILVLNMDLIKSKLNLSFSLFVNHLISLIFEFLVATVLLLQDIYLLQF